jgi:hypothetical protein
MILIGSKIGVYHVSKTTTFTELNIENTSTNRASLVTCYQHNFSPICKRTYEPLFRTLSRSTATDMECRIDVV